MNYLVDFLNSLYQYIFNLIGIDFTNYTGNLPTEFISMYSYVLDVFKIISIFFYIYLIYNFIIFLVSFGGVRK